MAKEKELVCNKINIPIVLNGKDFMLSCDRKNFTFRTLAQDKKGKTITVDSQYFSTLEGAMNHIFHLKIKAKVANTLSELQYNIKEAKDEICGLYGNLTEENLQGAINE